jgi:serine/threonine-protein kinase
MLAVVGTRQGPRQLFVRKLDQLQAAPLAGTEGAESPFFSPDGQWLGFFANGKLKKISVTGGAPVTLADAPQSRGAAWTDDDAIIFMPDLTPGLTFMRVSAAGGAPTPFGVMGTGAILQRWPQVLPGGQALLYTEHSSTTVGDGANVVVSSIKGDAPRILVRGGYFGRYVSSGHLVYLSQGTLFAVRFDLTRLEVVGPAVPALDDVATNGSAGLLTLAPDGTLLYEPIQIFRGDRSLDWMTRDGRTSALSAKKVNWSNPRFSPDGKRLAIQIHDAGQEDIWVYDLASDTRTQLTFDPGDDAYPVWTPDGKRIVFSSERDKTKGANLYWMNADGTGEPTRLTESPNLQVPMSWHPGGKYLSFFEARPGSSYDLMILPMEGDAVSGLKPGTPTVFLSTKAREAMPMFSPDGHWIAYMSDELGSSYDVLVRPFPQKAGGPRRVSTEGGRWPFWSATSPDLLFVTTTNKVMVAPYSVAGDVFTSGPPQPWSPIGFQSAPSSVSPYALHPDGKRVLLAAPAAQGALEERDKVVFYSGFGDYLKKIAPGTK